MLGVRMQTCGTCPFCGLLCSGIQFPLRAGTFSAATSPTPRVVRSDAVSPTSFDQCDRSKRGWDLAQPTPGWQLKPLRQGRSLEAVVAVREVTQSLLQSRRILFSGLATDVAGNRQVIDFARSVGGILDHMHSEALQLSLKLLQHGGWIATTLSEIKFRADTIVLVGDSILDRFPRLLALLANDNLPNRKLIWLGTDDIKFRSQAMLLPQVQCISIKKSDWLSALSSLLLNTSSKTANKSYTDTAAKFSSKLDPLMQALAASQYTSFVWSAADFLSEGDELILDVLVRLVAKLNQTSRAAVLPLAGSHGDVTAQQVCTWKTGFPLRQALHSEGVDYQPNRYGVADVLQHNDCDAVVYVSAFEPIEPPVEFWNVSGVKVIVGHPAMKSAGKADYFFPSAIPGIDHDCHLFRGDNVAVVSVEGKRESLAPSVAEWFGNFLNEVVSQRTSSTSSIA